MKTRKRCSLCVLPMLCSAAILLVGGTAGSGCGHVDKSAADKSATATAKVVAPQQPTAAAADEEAQKRAKAAQRVAERLSKVEADANTEAARWTDVLVKQSQSLVARDYRTPQQAIRAVLASPHRTPGNADRDVYRHPEQTLMFFGIRQDATVLEMGAGAGWYTELLAPLVAKRGKLIVGGYDPNGPSDSMRTVYGIRMQRFLAKSPDLFGKVQSVVLGSSDPQQPMNLGPDGSVDLALVMREMHNWHRAGDLDRRLAAMYAVLKPGGSLGIVQHRAKPDADPDDSASSGYLPQPWLIAKVQSVGFELAGTSEINANPNDTTDHPKGVWTLPPGLALKDQDAAKYKAIGESDRMTLRFSKPKQ